MDNKPAQVIGKRLGPGDDLEMIWTPSEWPLYPILPVKNWSKVCPLTGMKPMTGIIVHGRERFVIVGTLGLTDFVAAPEMEYPSVEELLEDRWVVD